MHLKCNDTSRVCMFASALVLNLWLWICIKIVCKYDKDQSFPDKNPLDSCTLTHTLITCTHTHPHHMHLHTLITCWGSPGWVKIQVLRC